MSCALPRMMCSGMGSMSHGLVHCVENSVTVALPGELPVEE